MPEQGLPSAELLRAVRRYRKDPGLMKLLGNWGPRCPNCLGAKKRYPKCEWCKGASTLPDPRGSAWPVKKCKYCKGKGRVTVDCYVCDGTGRAKNPG